MRKHCIKWALANSQAFTFFNHFCWIKKGVEASILLRLHVLETFVSGAKASKDVQERQLRWEQSGSKRQVRLWHASQCNFFWYFCSFRLLVFPAMTWPLALVSCFCYSYGSVSVSSFQRGMLDIALCRWPPVASLISSPFLPSFLSSSFRM